MAARLELTLDQALAFRLERQHLLAPAADPVAAASSLLGAQAQVGSAAMLQLRARSRTASTKTIGALLRDSRRLVRMWSHRATLHLVAIDDLPMTVALRRRHAPYNRSWLSRGGLEPKQIDALVAGIGEVLAEAGPLTRSQIAARLVPRLGPWAEPWLLHSWGGAIKLAAAEGLVCHGPDSNGDITFARLDRWVAVAELDDSAALAQLGRRYLASFGPATARDLARFAGMYAGPARAALAAIADETIPVTIDGKPAVALAADEEVLRAIRLPPVAIAVLPNFDPYLLSHADASGILPESRRAEIYRTAGWISAVVLQRGRVAATWTAKPVAGAWAATVVPFVKLGSRALGRIEKRLGELGKALGQKEVTMVLAKAS